ncbi:MAG: alpha/beta hydrolase-fold protein [Ginsengibacter sp.]
MMKIFIALFLSVIAAQTFAQFEVKINVSVPSLKHVEDSVYIAGSFNGWNPSSAQRLSLNSSGQGAGILYLDKGNYDYKFTRGSWEKSETNASGTGLANRKLTVNFDTVFNVVIDGWQDDFSSASQQRKSTASKHVMIMDTGFFMQQLGRTRRIWLYLPEGYNTSSEKYPVLYMHDGQNLFDNATSAYGEWGLDEFLDSLKSSQQYIVVGIDNGLAKRMNEYNPYAFADFGKGEGDAYVDFIVNTLKPYIDQRYRTKVDKKNTSIAGSSMGGLISLYAVLKYPKTFGSAGIFSPAFWTASGIDNGAFKNSKAVRSKLFFYAGGKESEKMIPDMRRIETLIRKHSPSKIKEVIDVNAQHNEDAWQKHFPAFYHWIAE